MQAHVDGPMSTGSGTTLIGISAWLLFVEGPLAGSHPELWEWPAAGRIPALSSHPRSAPSYSPCTQRQRLRQDG
jgi:hypothetical protein